MSKKGRALKALLILAIFIALCMYFARTVQTITTPKVTLIGATTGRLEQKIPVSASAYFPVKSEVTLSLAKEYPITVSKLYVKAGNYVKKGDTLFTATINDYDKQSSDFLKQYDEKAQALLELDITNRKSSKQSKQNDLYDVMIEKQEAQTKAENKARVAAAQEGITLTFDQSAWGAQAIKAGASKDVLALIDEAVAAKQAFSDAREAFFNSYENREIKVKDEVFKYINERNKLLRDMDEINDDMVKLLTAKEALTTVTASAEGYIVSIGVTAGEGYDGKAVAYVLAGKDDAPVLRADIQDIKKDVSEGARVELSGEWTTVKTSVLSVETGSDNRKYANIELTSDVLSEAGGMSKLLSDGAIELSLTFRSKKTTTIIPASCLRSEGEGADYIYTVERTYGGFLQSGGLICHKKPVTVVDRADKQVAIEEDLSYTSIINTADRALTDGKPVMENVD